MNQRPLSILVLNQQWLVGELEALGHRVVTAGWEASKVHIPLSRAPASVKEIFSKLPRTFRPDRLVYFDDSRPLGLTDLEDLDIPTLYYSVDTHHHLRWHKHFAAIFDKVLVAQKRYIPELLAKPKRISWFPVWTTNILTPAAEKTLNVSFRGSLNPKWHPDRKAFFERLSKLVQVDYATGPYQDIYTRSKIIVNEAVKDDLNFRVFEAMIGGAMLITPSGTTGLRDLFEPDRDLVLYQGGNEADAAEKIRYYLAHDDERQAIAERGRAKVLQFHTSTQRARELEAHLSELQVTPRENKYFHSGVTLLETARISHRVALSTSNWFLKIAAERLEKSAAEEHVQNNAFEAAIVHCKYLLELNFAPDVARKFIESICRQYPDHPILTITLIETLLTEGKKEEALQLASRISAAPEQVLLKVPEMLRVMRKEMSRHDQNVDG